jgi:hypothetical protein
VICYALLGLRGWLSAQAPQERQDHGLGARRAPHGDPGRPAGRLWGVLPILAMRRQGQRRQMPMLIASVIAGMIGCGGFAMLTLPWPPPSPIRRRW